MACLIPPLLSVTEISAEDVVSLSVSVNPVTASVTVLPVLVSERPLMVNAASEAAVVEHLRIKVPADALSVWHRAEEGSWEPWLTKQDGFLGRDLLWDPETEEGTLLIRWASREQWKAIPAAEVAQVQEQFERIARDGMGQTSGNPFPLVFEGELFPQ